MNQCNRECNHNCHNTDISKIREQHKEELASIEKFQRATNYLAAAQIYLQDNFLLKNPLKSEDIKSRLLGHWGTCPGINLVCAHLNRIINQYKANMFLVTGPGHGAPANLANLYLEGSLAEFYPELTLDAAGLEKFIKCFSWPGGFPSHMYPGVPGNIHEGGELGYALSTAYGAVMDNPDLIVACLVGDGEAETGPTATAWHSPKFLDPVESGAVLPIVHINGYKISSPTIYGTMTDEELNTLFDGYGYEACVVQGPDLDAALFQAMDWAYHKIKHIQDKARSGQPELKPKWPVILLRSPKGWKGIKEYGGVSIEGSCRSHQVPAKDLKTNEVGLKSVEEWFRSYKVEELFDTEGRPSKDLLDACPKGDLRMGCNRHTLAHQVYKPLKLKKLHDYQIQLPSSSSSLTRGSNKKKVSSLKSIALILSDTIKLNPKTFRIFSPDELESNQLNVFDATHRNFQWPVQKHDTNICSKGGRVLEILSEHTCQGWMQGYSLTGRVGLLPSYEAFLGVISTMVDQYAKFIKMAKETSWRGNVPSLNYIATSTLWRQEHNGYSHQNPGFINALLNKKGETVRIYLPPDANCALSTMDHCLQSQNYVNLIIAGKQELPQWLSMDEAIAHCRAGASIWKWASTEEGVNPDVVLVGIGDDVTVETLAAITILKKEVPDLRVRMINITDLLVLEKNSKHPHGMDQEVFEMLFTKDRNVVFNFHGYPSALYQLLFNRGPSEKFVINGYQEEGTTTTPFDMMVRNGTSRYHLAIQAIKYAAQHNPKVAACAQEKISKFEYFLKDHRQYIEMHGKDPEEITNWEWS